MYTTKSNVNLFMMLTTLKMSINLKYVVLWMCCVTLLNAIAEENVILTYKEKDHVEKVFSDGQSVVFAMFTPENQLIDCDVRVVNGTASHNIFLEVLENKDVRADLMLVDMKKIARQCKRFIRKMLRKKSDDVDQMVQKIKKRLRLHIGFKGTSWCASNPEAMVNRTEDPKYSKINNCCKKLHKCKDVIIPIQTKYQLFNRSPWNLYSCNCWRKFNSCLNQLETNKLARDITATFMNVLNFRCYETESVTSCEKWSDWFTSCVKSEKIIKAKSVPVLQL